MRSRVSATGLSPFLENYIAAMVEYACATRAVAVPGWTRAIARCPSPCSARSCRVCACIYWRIRRRRSASAISSSIRHWATESEAVALTQADIRRLFELLNKELGRSGTQGELFLVAAPSCASPMPLGHLPRTLTPCSGPPTQVREAAARVSIQAKVKADWLNDA